MKPNDSRRNENFGVQSVCDMLAIGETSQLILQNLIYVFSLKFSLTPFYVLFDFVRYTATNFSTHFALCIWKAFACLACLPIPGGILVYEQLDNTILLYVRYVYVVEYLAPFYIMLKYT